MENIFYSISDLLELGYAENRETLYRRVKRGDFPAPIKLGRSVRWLKTDIEQWLRKRGTP